MTLRQRLRLITLAKQESILAASFILAVTFVLSALLGFLRSRFLYARFFTCCTSSLDVYNAAFRIPDLIFRLLVTGALTSSFIPVYSQYLHRDQKTADQMASAVINLLCATFVAIATIAFIFARPLSHLVAPGFTEIQLELMTNLTRILLFAQIFFLISNFLTGIIQVHQIFLIPALSPIVYNICIILGIYFLTPTFGIYGVCLGVIIGAFFHLLIQIPLARRLGFGYTPIFNFHTKGVFEVIKLMIPRCLSLGLAEIESTMTLFWASTLSIGSISLLNLALQLMYLPSRIFGSTLGQASLPILSKSIAKNELEVFRQTVTRTILQSLFLALPITILVLVQRVAIVRITMGSRQFPWAATLLTAKTLAFLTPAIVSQALIQILVRSFYAMHNTKTPMYVAILSLISNVATSFYFVTFTDLGIVGLAISASVGNLIQFFGLLYFFIQKVDGFQWPDVGLKTAKISISSTLLGISIWASMRFLDLFVFDTSRTASVIAIFSITSLVGVIVYLGTSHIFGIDELKDFTRVLKKRFL